MTEGTAPPRKRPVRGKHDWYDVARRLSDTPGRWILADHDVSTSMAWRAGNDQIAPLRDLRGRIEYAHRDTAFVTGNRGTSRYGDLWLRWVPEGWTEEAQQAADIAEQNQEH